MDAPTLQELLEREADRSPRWSKSPQWSESTPPLATTLDLVAETVERLSLKFARQRREALPSAFRNLEESMLAALSSSPLPSPRCRGPEVRLRWSPGPGSDGVDTEEEDLLGEHEAKTVSYAPWECLSFLELIRRSLWQLQAPEPRESLLEAVTENPKPDDNGNANSEPEGTPGALGTPRWAPSVGIILETDEDTSNSPWK
jgi:hypothetical protein